MRKMKIVYFFLIVNLASFFAVAQEQKKSHSWQEIREIECDEKKELELSRGNVERKDRDLNIKLEGFIEKDHGLFFRTSQKNKDGEFDSFEYCGTGPDYFLVRQIFAHDAPTNYFIEKGGRIHRASTDEYLLVSPDQNQALMMTNILQQDFRVLLLSLSEKKVSHPHWDIALKCKSFSRFDKADSASRQVNIIELTSRKLVIEAQQLPAPSFPKNKLVIDRATFVKNPKGWNIQNREGIFKKLTCD